MHDFLKHALAWIGSLGPWGPAAFVLFYIVACVVCLPAVILTLGAGAIFGPVWGSIYVSLGATLGATAAFLVGRYLARGWIARRVQGDARFKAIDEGIALEGWKIVLLTRMTPLLPFTLLNYAFGLTRVSLREYFWGSCLGMMPATVLYVYAGSLAGDIAALPVGMRRTRTPAEWALYGIGLIAGVIVMSHLTRIAGRAIRNDRRG